MTKRTREQYPKVAKERSAPFTVTMSDGSYLQWDKDDGLFRVAYYARRTAKEFYMRPAIALAMKKPAYSPQVDIIMKYLEERQEYVEAVST